ncbi:MAG: FkbM family methyltransferase [Candidatus Bathyarchaeota archaeon]|nr:FkbM family methyltransferase [Candidatus Bathyarchaeota archaeon]
MPLLRLVRKILPAKCRMQLTESAKKWLFLVPLFGIACGVLIIPWRRGAKVIGIWDGKLILLNASFDFDAVAFFLEIFQDRVYEREYCITSSDVVIDVGAHVGMFTLKAAEKARLVIAFEPNKENLRHLYKNTRGKDNVIIVPKALGKSKGSAKFLQLKRSGTGQLAYLTKPPDGAVKAIIEVDVDTLDNCIKSFGLRDVSFLKIDAEGAEVDILKGGEETLRMIKHIAMELHYQGEAKEVAEFLKERGFRVKVIRDMLYANKARR